MRRREFIGLVGSTAAVWPLAARAQQPAKVKRIAMVHASEPAASMVASYHRTYRAFFDELSRLGFVEGKNLVVERYSAQGQMDYTKLSHDVAETRPDAIFALEGGLGLAFKAATTTIPIVATVGDPVAMGLVSNIARPGGNVTGTSIDSGIEIWGKLSAYSFSLICGFACATAIQGTMSIQVSAIAARSFSPNETGMIGTKVISQCWSPGQRGQLRSSRVRRVWSR